MLVFAKRSARTLLVFAFCATCASGQGWQHVGTVQRVERLQDGVELTAGRAKVRVTTFNDSVIRVRVAPQGNFPRDSSWAVIADAHPAALKVEDAKNELKMTAANTTVVVQKSPLLIRFADASGNVLLADEPSRPMAFDGPASTSGKKCPPMKTITASVTRPDP